MRVPDSFGRPTVAHLVTPYLFTTGAWIHAQIAHSRRFRPVVMTQQTENVDVFPAEPVYDFRGERSRLTYGLSKYVLGRFPSGPYEGACRHEGVRLLHAHLGWEGARTVHLRRRLGIPHITSFYGRDASMLPRKAYWRTLYRRLFAQGDLFIAEGGFMAKTLERIGCPPEKVRVVHLGVDPSRIPFRERRPDPDGSVTALLAASFREKKGIVYALEALASVAERYPALRLRVIGDGPLRGEIERRIEALRLGQRVTLLGYRNYPDYLSEMERAQLLLCPSVTAADGDCEGGAPVCLLDAQAAGLPVVATRHCDIPEVTVPDRSAYLAPERDSAGLAAALDRLLSDPASWASMGRAGRDHVEREFSAPRQADAMADVYEHVLAERS